MTFKPTASGNRSGTLTITDNASTSPQVGPLAGAGEDFAIAVSSGTSSSATVAAGGTATYTITLSPQGGFNQTVTLSCSGAPPKATCTPSQSAITLDGSNPHNITFTVPTTASTLVLPRVRDLPTMPYDLLMADRASNRDV